MRSKIRNSLSEHVLFCGPSEFRAEEVFCQDDLFRHRAALFLTPTKNIPSQWIGKGSLDVRLSTVTPDLIEFQEIRSYAIPRFWVDLIQQATEKIRWVPLEKAYVRIIRYDQVRDDHFRNGTKALCDSLKFKTSGRRDGRCLYYFGAILNDDADSATIERRQEIVACKSLCGVRIQVIDMQ